MGLKKSRTTLTCPMCKEDVYKNGKILKPFETRTYGAIQSAFCKQCITQGEWKKDLKK